MMEENSTTWSHYDAATGIGVGTTGAMIVSLWPFVAAHLRGKISRDELIEAFQRAMGETGRDLAIRIAIGAALGPVYVWYPFGISAQRTQRLAASTASSLTRILGRL